MSAVTFTTTELDTMSYRDMQGACKSSGLKATGKGDELRQRLSALLSTVLSDSTNNSPQKAAAAACAPTEAALSVEAAEGSAVDAMDATEAADEEQTPSPRPLDVVSQPTTRVHTVWDEDGEPCASVVHLDQAAKPKLVSTPVRNPGADEE
jgi:hypothetical protein